VRRAVGINQTVHAEVAVVRILAGIAAVAVDRLVFRGDAGINGVVAPFPDKTAAGSIICFDRLIIVFDITGAVAHRVYIFTQEKRLVRAVFAVIGHFLHGSIHAAV